MGMMVVASFRMDEKIGWDYESSLLHQHRHINAWYFPTVEICIRKLLSSNEAVPDLRIISDSLYYLFMRL